MFKMKGITPLATHDNDNHYKSQNGYHTYWGGSNVFTSGSIAVFNEKYASQGYMLKPANAAQNGTNTDEWWINAFLIFGVDGRANNRDQGTKFYPTDQLDGTKTVDDAMADARQFLKDHAVEVETAMHGLKGFEKPKSYWMQMDIRLQARCCIFAKRSTWQFSLAIVAQRQKTPIISWVRTKHFGRCRFNRWQ